MGMKHQGAKIHATVACTSSKIARLAISNLTHLKCF